jgi:hypothetical protein
MEPIRQTKTARLGNLKLYREHLDELVSLFQNACATVTISDSQNRYDSLDEMRQVVGSRIPNLDIRGERPGVHLLLNQQEQVRGSTVPSAFNELRTEEIAKEAEDLFFRVKDFLVGHQQPRVRSWCGILAIVCLVGLFWHVLHNSAADENGRIIIHGAVRFSLWVLGLGGFLVATVNVKTYLTLDTRLNSPSFFVRNREDFARHAVTAMSSGIIGGVVGWLLGHSLK